MSDREAFLGAIRDAPEDHRVRRVYADWLEENGEPEVAAEQRRLADAVEDGRKFLHTHLRPYSDGTLLVVVTPETTWCLRPDGTAGATEITLARALYYVKTGVWVEVR